MSERMWELVESPRVAPSILSSDFARLGSQVAEVIAAGADSITFHVEATAHANRTLGAIRELGCLAGVAINPGTPAEAVSELRGLADLVLCMSVNPGWGGQSFIESSPAKVERLRPLVGAARIEVDGGIDLGTVGPMAAA